MEIHASGKLDFRTIKALWRASGGGHRALRIILLAVYALLTAWCGYNAYRYDYVYYQKPTRFTLLFVFCLVMLVLLIVSTLRIPNRSYKLLGKRRDAVNEFVFRDDHFEVTSHADGYEASGSIAYTQLEKAIESPEFFFLYETKRTCYPVDKATIENGMAEELAEKLKTVLGKNYKVRKK